MPGDGVFFVKLRLRRSEMLPDGSVKFLLRKSEIKFAHSAFRQKRTDSLRCGEATAVASVHRTLAKSRLSNPSSHHKKDQSRRIGLFVHTGSRMMDSKGRSKQTVRWTVCPAVARPQPGESVLPHKKGSLSNVGVEKNQNNFQRVSGISRHSFSGQSKRVFFCEISGSFLHRNRCV